MLYTLGGPADKERGWGRAGETWAFMASLGELGGETWFQLGDRDLALHVWRTHQLRERRTLTEIVAEVARRFAIRASVLPMSDDPVRTIVETPDGPLAFQRYFVERRCAPHVARRPLSRAPTGRDCRRRFGTPCRRRDSGAIVICPSNPFLSVDPILAIAGRCAR